MWFQQSGERLIQIITGCRTEAGGVVVSRVKQDQRKVLLYSGSLLRDSRPILLQIIPLIHGYAHHFIYQETESIFPPSGLALRLALTWRVGRSGVPALPTKLSLKRTSSIPFSLLEPSSHAVRKSELSCWRDGPRREAPGEGERGLLGHSSSRKDTR